jgi:hypothetical protein
LVAKKVKLWRLLSPGSSTLDARDLMAFQVGWLHCEPVEVSSRARDLIAFRPSVCRLESPGKSALDADLIITRRNCRLEAGNLLSARDLVAVQEVCRLLALKLTLDDRG